MAHLEGQHAVHTMVSPVLNSHQCSLLIQASRQANSYFKYIFLLTTSNCTISFVKLDTASTPLHHAPNSFSVYECKFRLGLNNATCLLWDKSARKITPFYSGNRKHVHYNIAIHEAQISTS